LCSSCQQIHLCSIFDLTKISAGLAITIDKELFTFDDATHPLGDYCSIGTIRILAFAKDIEIF
jgi:hypothetical protein